MVFRYRLHCPIQPLRCSRGVRRHVHVKQCFPTNHARQLHESAGVPYGSCGISEIKKFQAALPDYQLNVISKEHLNALIYSGPEAEKHLYLYHHDDHYDVITSMACLPRPQKVLP